MKNKIYIYIFILIFSTSYSEQEKKNSIKNSLKNNQLKYSKAGLINSDGTIHEIFKIKKFYGKRINVVNFGADLSSSDFDDSKAIQKAIDFAKIGDEIYLPNGSYQLFNTIKLKTGIILKGESRDKTILEAKKINNTYKNSIIKIYGKNRIILSDFTITSDFSGKYTTDHKTNNPNGITPKYAIRIEDNPENFTPSYNIIIKNVLVEKFKSAGIRIAKSHDIIVKDCIFQNATDLGPKGSGYGVAIQGAGHNKNRLGYQNDSRFNIVENCVFKGPYLRHGTLIQYFSHNNLIRNNKYYKIKLDAIDLHGEDEYLNEIYNNYIEDIKTGAGIGVGNTGATHDKSGSGNYIHNNTIINSREGIKVELSTEGTVIENNEIKNSKIKNGKGIYILKASNTIIIKNIIKNNLSKKFWGIILKKDKGTEGRGKGIPEDIFISENIIDNCTNGISIEAGKNIKLKNNKLNLIRNKKFIYKRE